MMNARTRKQPVTFFALLFTISIPFWILGALVKVEDLPVNLPLSALMAFNPLIAASILVYRESGAAGLRQFLGRILDFKRIRNKAWYLPIFLLLPLISFLVYVIKNLRGDPLPDPQFPIQFVPVMFAVFFIAGAGEEMGWQGYAYEAFEERWSALRASLMLSAVYVVWHTIPFVQTGNTVMWIVWQSGVSVGLRILTAWLYNVTGKSLFAAIMFHAIYNVSTYMFPNYGSHYDPILTCVLILIVVGVVVYLWGAKTLASYRYHYSLQVSGQ